jgi:hypothetical protein
MGVAVDELAKFIGYTVMMVAVIYFIVEKMNLSDYLEMGIMLFILGMMFVVPTAFGLYQMYKGNYFIGIVLVAFGVVPPTLIYKNRHKGQ